MKIKPMIIALGLSLLLLSGCVASVGPEYGGYYPPAPRPYYGYARPYYAPRPVIVVPARPYRQGYGGGYRGDGGHGGYHGGGGNHGGGGGYHGGGGHGRGR